MGAGGVVGVGPRTESDAQPRVDIGRARPRRRGCGIVRGRPLDATRAIGRGAPRQPTDGVQSWALLQPPYEYGRRRRAPDRDAVRGAGVAGRRRRADAGGIAQLI